MLKFGWEDNIVTADDDRSPHDERAFSQPWLEDEAFEDGSASTKSSEDQRNFDWDQKPKYNAKHRPRFVPSFPKQGPEADRAGTCSETFRGDKDRFNKGRFGKNELNHQPAKYARPEPSPALFGAPLQPQVCKNKQCAAVKLQLAECQRLLEDRDKELNDLEEEHEKAIKDLEDKDEGTFHEMRIQIFHGQKDAEQYEEVDNLYQRVVIDKELEGSDDPVILRVKHCYAEALFEQEKFADAEIISKAVWDKKKKTADPLPDDVKQSHKQLSAIYFARGKLKHAIKLHRKMYEREPPDDWTLDNGDELCQKLAADGKDEDAYLEQGRVRNLRHKFNGPRHELTVQSGLREIGFGDKIIKDSEEPAGSDEEETKTQNKKRFEVKIKASLKRLWDDRAQPGPEKVDEFLDIGLRLGDIYMAEEKFPEAEGVLVDVWAGRKLDPGEKDLSTLSIGSKIGKALMGQGGEDNHRRAAGIFRDIWDAKLSFLRKSNPETISSAEDLSGALWCLRDWPGAGDVFQWILDRKNKKLGPTAPETIDVRCRLAQALINQDRAKCDQAAALLKELYPQLKAEDPKSGMTLHFGHMLADRLYLQKALSTPEEPTEDEVAALQSKTNEILNVIEEVFNHKETVEEKDVMFVSSGRLCGELLLEAKKLSEAERVLGIVWSHPVSGPEEQMLHLNCGHFYAQSMIRDSEHPEVKEGLEKAKDILGEVLEAQKSLFPKGSEVIAETKSLLKDVNQRLKDVETKPSPKVPVARKGRRSFFGGSR